MLVKIFADGHVWETEVKNAEEAIDEMETNPMNGTQCSVSFENGYSFTHHYLDEDDDGEERSDLAYILYTETGLALS